MKKSGPSIGLALGGGGARGLAHIPVLEAFDELGLKPARIAGTSIGAIMGAAYASGLSGSEIRAHTIATLSEPRKVIGRLMELRPRRLREFLKRGEFNPFLFDPERVLERFLPEAVARDFNDLAIPLSVIATDFYGRKEKVITRGPLRAAIAASVALPTIFRPVQLDKLVLFDGGLVNPLPIDKVATCDIVVAIDVVGGREKRSGRELPTVVDAVFGASQILMQSITTEKLRHDQADILLKPDINQFRVLDFLKAAAVLKAADPIKDEVKRGLDTLLNAST